MLTTYAIYDRLEQKDICKVQGLKPARKQRERLNQQQDAELIRRKPRYCLTKPGTVPNH